MICIKCKKRKSLKIIVFQIYSYLKQNYVEGNDRIICLCSDCLLETKIEDLIKYSFKKG